MNEFELEHWRSRALVAEKERDSARSVLAALRTYHREPTSEHAAKVLEARKKHDVTWWNVDHVVAAVREVLPDDEDPPCDD